ncbi:hypothetical protein [Acidithiobacillus sp. AMEEHan]|uniref:hypothetical protein n=1 Tax=Acidithiobacillus sp. AMEEHan TaxID=2994951 RepID=UPI0027E3D8FF|nr:hypothetical protein [Acidithiobacillus sp. AMEEHan]
MRKLQVPLFLLATGLLGACAQIPAPVPNHAALAQSRASQADQAARLAEERLAAVTAQRRAAEKQFCSSWQRSLDLVRRDAIGCVHATSEQQGACWDAVANWAGAKGEYYAALQRLFVGHAYAEPAQAAGNFFQQTQVWAQNCRSNIQGCLQEASQSSMQAQKAVVNRFCAARSGAHG